MSTGKSTIVIGCGGWQTPESHENLICAFKAAGYEVHSPGHPSTNEGRPQNTGLQQDTAAMRSYVENLVDSGRQVIALLHLYGDQAGSNSLYGLSKETRHSKGLSGGVSHIVHMCAFSPTEGMSITNFKEMGHVDLVPTNPDDDKTAIQPDPRGQLKGTDVHGEALQEYLSCPLCCNGNSTYQGVDNRALRKIPVTYIQATKDTTNAQVCQKSRTPSLKEHGRKVVRFELNTDHYPNIPATDAIVKIVEKVVA